MLKFGTIIAAIIIFFIAFSMESQQTQQAIYSNIANPGPGTELELEDGVYAINNCEFNLARMEVRTIKRAFRTFPKDPVTEIAKKLSISTRTLHRKIKQYDLGCPRELRCPDKEKKA